MRVTGILPLGRECQKHIPADFQAGSLENWLNHFIRCAGVGRALQNNDLSRAQVLGDTLGRLDHVAQIGFQMRGKRRWHANQERVGFPETAEIAGGVEPAGGNGSLHRLGADVIEVALPAVQRLRLRRIDVETEHAQPGVGGGKTDGQANIA